MSVIPLIYTFITRIQIGIKKDITKIWSLYTNGLPWTVTYHTTRWDSRIIHSEMYILHSAGPVSSSSSSNSARKSPVRSSIRCIFSNVDAIICRLPTPVKSCLYIERKISQQKYIRNFNTVKPGQFKIVGNNFFLITKNLY